MPEVTALLTGLRFWFEKMEPRPLLPLPDAPLVEEEDAEKDEDEPVEEDEDEAEALFARDAHDASLAGFMRADGDTRLIRGEVLGDNDLRDAELGTAADRSVALPSCRESLPVCANSLKSTEVENNGRRRSSSGDAVEDVVSATPKISRSSPACCIPRLDVSGLNFFEAG